MNLSELTAPFEKALTEPGEQVRQWKAKQGGRAVGFLMTDVPEELIHAAGFFPYGIAGGNAEMEAADAHLQPWICSYARNCLALALGGKLDFLDGLIVPQNCDTTRMFSDLLNHIRPFPYMDIFRMPRQVGRSSAGSYLIGEMERLKYGLEQYAGKPIDHSDLRSSIALYNRNRELLRRIADIHAQNPNLISSRDLYTLINGSMIMPREEVGELLTAIREVLEGLTGSGNAGNQVRLLLSGTLLEPLEILDLIDQCGGTVIGDDFQNGFRYIESDVAIKDDLLDALAERQLNRIPSSAFDIEHRQRRYYLTEVAEDKNASGVIFLHLGFCEPENFDSYDNLQAMKRAGIPAIRIETQFGRSTLGQIRTRIQAFMEMVGGDDSGCR